MIAIDRLRIPRMEGVTVGYTEAGRFRFLHEGEGRNLPRLTMPRLN